MFAEDIIIKYIVNEKSGVLKETLNQHTFIVDKRANKTQIKYAIEKLFGVKVARVNTANYDGKLKIQGRSQGYTASYKKAYVTLTADSKPMPDFAAN